MVGCITLFCVRYFSFILGGWLYNPVCIISAIYLMVGCITLFCVRYFSFILGGWLYNSVCVISDIFLMVGCITQCALFQIYS